MPDENDPPQSPPEQPTLLGNVAPDEMFARGMQTAKMTSGAQGTWQPPSIEECARLFPGYEVLRLLGRGGMGAVYLARQIELDRLVAIKLLPLEISVDKDFADRFRREARAMAKLHHPHIITVFDFGSTREGHLYFVMEYVEGANLADLIHQAGLTPEQALSIVEQVCTALVYAHSKGVVHRDIKPANVMIDTECQVKVADFGLARLTDPSAEQWGHTMTGTVMGTPDYMAPEQMKGMNVDHRADIYSLGVMVYEMLCREVPRGAFEPPSVRAGCDPRIDPIVLKAMQPNPERRYQSTQEMRTDVTIVRASASEAGPPRRGIQSEAPSDDEGQRGALSPPAPPKKPATPKAPPKAPLAPLETAVMQAIAPPAVAKRSKLSLYAGLAAVVAVIAAVIIWAKQSNTPEGTRSGASQTSAGADGGDQRSAEIRSSEPLEPGAIRLWDSPAALASAPSAAKVTWENAAVRHEGGASLNDRSLIGRDGILRVTIRTNTDAKIPVLGMRSRMVDDKNHSYALRFETSRHLIELRVWVASRDRIIASWPLPRTYKEDEWARIEWRLVGDTHTIKLDGLLIGEARDTSVPKAGNVSIFAGGNTYFRDIVYVPLDKAAATPALSSATEPWHDWLAEQSKAGGLPKELTPEGDGYRVVSRFDQAIGPVCRDQAVRPTFRRGDGSAGTLQAQVRTRSKVGEFYRVSAADSLWLNHWINAKDIKTLATIPLPPELTRDKNREMTVEMRVVGDLLMVKLDGQIVATERDTSVKEGQPSISCPEGWWIKKIEWLDLDKAAPREPFRPASATSSSASTPGTAKATNESSAVQTFGGHRYQRVLEISTWPAAKSKAEAIGGHLATLSTPEEEAWIRSAFSMDKPIWIGGFAKQGYANNQWVTGEPFGKVPWAAQNPTWRVEKGQGSTSGTLFEAGLYLGSDGVHIAQANSQFACAGFLVEWENDGHSSASPVSVTKDAPLVNSANHPLLPIK